MTNGNERFGAIERLYGKRAFKRLQECHIAVIGIGGVGSWCAEALARSGVGSVTLVDLDEICVTNTNRQVHAISSTVGQSKVKVMAARMKEINPDIKLNVVEDFFTADTVEMIFSTPFDGVIDAIDSLSNKALCVVACKQRGIPLVTVGGAGGRRDPLAVEAKDLGLTLDDKLLYRLRKKLKRDHNFPRGRKKFKVMAVFSREKQVFPGQDGEVCDVPPEGESAKLDCFSGLGSATHVTATFAMVAVSQILSKVLEDKEVSSS